MCPYALLFSNSFKLLFNFSNEEVDALILCTKNASDIAKVIKYRKEHLDSAMQGIQYIVTEE